MWFRSLRSHHNRQSRKGVAAGSRRSRTRGPRVVETLEDRALMSMMGEAHPIMHHPKTTFVQTNLVSDLTGQNTLNKTPDPDLLNPWGLVSTSTSPWWISDNNAGLSTVYNGNTGAKLGLKVNIPSPMDPTGGGTPTGIVANTNMSEFLVSGTGTAAHFIWATEDGTIAAWNSGPSAVIKVDNSAIPTAANGAVYKGLAMGSVSTADFLYATNFRAGTIDVFDSAFHQVTPGTGAISGTFTDPHIPRGYAPFGIKNINGDLFVTYAKQDASKHDDAAGPGRGFVDEFDTSGHLIERVAQHGALNSPWGLAIAPSSFGRFSGDLLVGNFGNGRINAFKPEGNGRFRFDGQLSNAQGHPITIDGLWGLAVGNNAAAGPSTTLFFTAGLNGEADGLFGTLTASM